MLSSALHSPRGHHQHLLGPQRRRRVPQGPVPRWRNGGEWGTEAQSWEQKATVLGMLGECAPEGLQAVRTVGPAHAPSVEGLETSHRVFKQFRAAELQTVVSKLLSAKEFAQSLDEPILRGRF